MKEIASNQAQQHAQVLSEFKSSQNQFNERFRMRKSQQHNGGRSRTPLSDK